MLTPHTGLLSGTEEGSVSAGGESLGSDCRRVCLQANVSRSQGLGPSAAPAVVIPARGGAGMEEPPPHLEMKKRRPRDGMERPRTRRDGHAELCRKTLRPSSDLPHKPVPLPFSRHSGVCRVSPALTGLEAQGRPAPPTSASCVPSFKMVQSQRLFFCHSNL